MRTLLDRARTHHLVLNPENVQLRRKTVPFIGYILTDDGFKEDQSKIEAIMKMPTPTDVTALKKMYSMVSSCHICQKSVNHVDSSSTRMLSGVGSNSMKML